MTLQLYKGNRLPILTDTLTINSVAYDLSGSTVLFSMRGDNSATTKISGATATITSPSAGGISYAWTAGDVDTVGSYLAWWTVNTGGKLQDTPEFALSIIEHAPTSIRINNPVGAGGVTTIVQGDAYLAAFNRQLQYEVEPMDAPDLTGSTCTFRIEGQNHYTMTVVGEDAVYVDLTSTQTAAIPIGTYAFEIKANVSTGNFITLMRSTITVNPIMSSP